MLTTNVTYTLLVCISKQINTNDTIMTQGTCILFHQLLYTIICVIMIFPREADEE